VTVALAAALQESKLQNLPYGDRDSLGLFQQRPSQGWGTRAQLLDPSYAADAFYAQLAKVPGWRTMPVAEAAQRVQRSASGAAYADWENEARDLARALTGQVPAALSCQFAKPKQPASGTLAADMETQLGPNVLGVSLPRNRGWAVATWLVASGDHYGIQAVSFDGQRWTNSSRGWHPDKAATSTVRMQTFTRS
jgi:hypothetical protein